MQAIVTFVSVFGPSRADEESWWPVLRNCLDTFPRPLVIVTSTTRGWDAMGRRYADETRNVTKLVFKADMSKGWKQGVHECNEWMASIVSVGVTARGATTEGTLDMLRVLERAGKRVVLL